MTFDSNLPLSLQKTQQWFASIITRPIDIQSRIMPLSPTGIPMEHEAALYIVSSPTLLPHQRIELYNQQYWWRFLNTLHETFPLLTRLFGFTDFNQQIGMPYICKYPSNHWSLNFLGNRLPQWVMEEYHAEDKKLIYDAASLDWAFNDSFFAAEYAPVDTSTLQTQEGLSALLDKTLYLQPSISLFTFDYDLFTLRSELLKESPDYWIEQEFPQLKEGKYYFILYRNKHYDISWSEVSSTAYAILEQFQKGGSIDSICDWLETADEATSQEASDNLQAWFQEWIIRRWLTPQAR